MGRAGLVPAAPLRALHDLQTPAGMVAERFKKLRHAEIAVAGFKFGFKIESVGAEAS